MGTKHFETASDVNRRWFALEWSENWCAFVASVVDEDTETTVAAKLSAGEVLQLAHWCIDAYEQLGFGDFPRLERL